jgi:hypothetical protein
MEPATPVAGWYDRFVDPVRGRGTQDRAAVAARELAPPFGGTASVAMPACYSPAHARRGGTTTMPNDIRLSPGIIFVGRHRIAAGHVDAWRAAIREMTGFGDASDG